MNKQKNRPAILDGSTSMAGMCRKHRGLHDREAFAHLIMPILMILTMVVLTLTLTVSAIANPIAIMPLGDSITYDNNFGDTRPQDMKTGYRQPLWTDLIHAGYNIDFVGSLSAGQSAVPAFDPDNEGHPGWSDLDMASEVYRFLADNPPEIVLLHIGTNDLDTDPGDVEEILNQIDLFENDYNHPIDVVLALIINRNIYSSLTTDFNNNIYNMAQNRINHGDSLVIVDLEDRAGLDYRLVPLGDMADNLHPATSGYRKMADAWFAALTGILPVPEAYAPEIITEPPLTAFVGIPFQYDMFAKGNPLPEYYLQSGPSGAGVDMQNGTLTWVPDAIGPHTIILQAANPQGTDIQSFIVDVETLDKIWIEAESGLVLAPMQSDTDPTASGTGFVWCGDGDGGSVEVAFDVAEAGEYIVWGRVIAASSGSNSFLFSMNGAPEAIWDLPINADWQWDKVNARYGENPSIFYLDAGRHTLRIGKREAGARLDRLLITSDDAYIPTGTGETVGTFALNTQVSGSGFVIWDPDLAAYTPGQTVTIEAIPDAGWQFIGWSGDLSGNTNPTSIVMNTAMTVVANFSESNPDPQPEPDKIWIEAEDGLVVAPLETGTDPAASADSYVWSQGGTGGYVEFQFEISEPGDYVVWGRVFAADSSSNSFAAFVDSTSSEVWKLPITQDWVWDLVNTRGGDDPRVFHLEAGAHTLQIRRHETGARLDRILITSDTTFVPINMGDPGSPVEYALDVNVSGSGQVFTTPSNGPYLAGSAVVLEAVPATGWQFNGWSGDLGGSDNPATVIMDGTKTITGLFSAVATQEYDLTINSSGSGQVIASPPVGPYSEGTVVFLEATANPDWQFTGWSGDLGGNANPTSIVMNAAMTVAAHFTESGPEPEPEPDKIWIEAEDGLVVAPLENGTDPTASAGNYVWSQDGTGGYVEFQFEISVPGDYVVWGRVFAADKSSNSFSAFVDDYSSGVWKLPITQDWVWDLVNTRGGDDPRVFHLDAGYHTLQIRRHETGARLDRILITSDDTFVPTNMGDPGSSVEYALDVNVSGSGQVFTTPSNGPYLAGSTVVLEAIPATGWQFDGWSGDLSGNANPTSIVMNAAMTVAANFSESNPDPQPDPDKIWIEAEDGLVVAPLETGTDPTASASSYVWSQGGTGGYVEFQFEISVPGDYVVWGRVFAADKSSNSFAVFVDSTSSEVWKLPITQDWVWDLVNTRGGDDPRVFHLDAGYHTLQIRRHETGARLDRILITNNLLFQP